MTPKWEWVDGQWWVGLPEGWYKQGSINGRYIRGVLYVSYDTFCEAFPGFNTIATPEPDEVQEDDD